MTDQMSSSPYLSDHARMSSNLGSHSDTSCQSDLSSTGSSAHHDGKSDKPNSSEGPEDSGLAGQGKGPGQRLLKGMFFSSKLISWLLLWFLPYGGVEGEAHCSYLTSPALFLLPFGFGLVELYRFVALYRVDKRSKRANAFGFSLPR